MLGPAVGYTDLLNNETIELMEKEAQEASTYHPIRPSNSGGCTRELAYKLAEFTGLAKYDKKVETAETHRLLSLGGYIENHLVRMIERFLTLFKSRYKQQVLEFYQLTSKTDPSLSHMVEGSLDLCLFSAKYRCVIDIKSKKDRFSAAYASQWEQTTAKLMRMTTVQQISETAFWVEDLPAFLEELRDPFFAANFLQLNGYACTEFLRKRGVDHGAILQYNKNSSEIREVRFKPSQELFDQIRNKFQVVLDAIGAKNIELAPKDYALGSIKCAFCVYSKQCWGDRDSLKEYLGSWKKDDPITAVDGIKAAAAVQELFAKYEEYKSYEEKAEAAEEDILKLLLEEDVKRIKLSNGHVYALKYLKGEDAIKLRRGKE